VQFNDSGSFGGDSGLVYNKSTNALTIGAGSLNMTGSSSGTVTIQPAAAAGTYSLTLPTSDGDAGQYLKSDGSGVLSWDTPASVGGSDTQVQFNDGGVLAGDSGLTFNKTSKALTLGGATITTSSPVIDAAQTWNAGGVTFTGLKLNVTDTASGGGSLLMDLQRGGVSQFSVRKDGYASATSGLTIGPASGNVNVALASVGGVSGIGLASTLGIGWVSGPQAFGTPDLFLSRRGAANLRFGAADAAAPVAQTLSVQSVVAGTTNTAGANLTITGSQGTGTGAGGSIIFQVAPAGSSGTAQNALVNLLEVTSTRRLSLYNTYTDATTFERANIFWDSNVLKIGTEKGSVGGTARALEFQTDGTTRLTIAATTGNVTTTGSVTTEAPTGGTAAAWRLGTVASVSPTSPNRTIEVDIGGTIYYISAKTTND
jgi:hypothetical protein